MTTLAAPPTRPDSASSDARLLTIHANLLPDELLDARAGRVARKRAVIAVAAAAALMLVLTGLAKWQTSSAQSDLSNAQQRATALTNQQMHYSNLVNAKSETTTIQTQLSQLMVNDVNWSKLFATMRTAAPGGVAIISFTSQVTASSAGSQSVANPDQIFNTTDSTVVGTVTINGTAKTKTQIAAYMDSLAKVLGIAAPYPAQVTEASGAVGFHATCLVTAKALGGRFTNAATSTTPATTTPATGGTK